MKIGRKGFMLAEVIIVSVIMITVLVTMYIGLNNVASAYDTRNRYYDVDCLYAAIEVNNVLLKNYSGIINQTIQNDEVRTLSDEVSDQDVLDVISFKQFYNTKVNDNINFYLTPYDKDKVLELINLDSNKSTKETFDDYLKYLSGNLDFNDGYDYMIIAERIDNNNIDDCYYYALKLKY